MLVATLVKLQQYLLLLPKWNYYNLYECYLSKATMISINATLEKLLQSLWLRPKWSYYNLNECYLIGATISINAAYVTLLQSPLKHINVKLLQYP